VVAVVDCPTEVGGTMSATVAIAMEESTMIGTLHPAVDAIRVTQGGKTSKTVVDTEI